MAQAPQPLQSKAVKRSEYLAQALKSMQEAPREIGGYGGLAARLGAQLLTKRQLDKSEKAADQEAAASLARRRDALSQFTNPLAATMMGQPAAAPTADAADEAMFRASGGGYQGEQAIPGAQTTPQPAPQPQQSQVPPALAQRIQMLAGQGPEGLAQAETLMNGYLDKQATMPMLPPEIASDPRMVYLAQTNPEAFTKALSEQYAPQVIAAGGIQSIAGTGQQIRNPVTREFGTQLVRDTPDGVQVLAERGPTYSEQAALQNANTQEANAGFTLAPGQQRYGPGGQLTAQSTAPTAPNAQQVEAQNSLTTLNTEVVPTLQQMRQALQSGDVITGFGAETRLQAARALAAIGNEDARRQVAATEAYRNSSGRLRVGMAKSLGANPSNADIQLLEKITAGDIGQNSDSLLATIDQGLNFANTRATALGSQVGGQPQAGGGISREAALAELRRRGLVQ